MYIFQTFGLFPELGSGCVVRFDMERASLGEVHCAVSQKWNFKRGFWHNQTKPNTSRSCWLVDPHKFCRSLVGYLDYLIEPSGGLAVSGVAWLSSTLKEFGNPKGILLHCNWVPLDTHWWKSFLWSGTAELQTVTNWGGNDAHHLLPAASSPEFHSLSRNASTRVGRYWGGNTF